MVPPLDGDWLSLPMPFRLLMITPTNAFLGLDAAGGLWDQLGGLETLVKALSSVSLIPVFGGEHSFS